MTGDRINRAANALAEWLGLNSWVDIAMMQMPDKVEEFKRIIAEAE